MSLHSLRQSLPIRSAGDRGLPMSEVRMADVRLQPILDRQARIIGFESLARLASDAFVCSTEDAIARLSVEELQRLTRELLLGLRIRCMLDCSYANRLNTPRCDRQALRHFVNVEKRSLAEPDLVEEIIDSAVDLRSAGVLLVVEVTERPVASFASFRSYLQGLMRLKQEGLLIALDDYDLDDPFHWELDLGLCDFVKLDLQALGVPFYEDGAFMDERYAVLGEKLYQFIHRYQVDLVAEKVETVWQNEVAHGLPFKLFQGYRFGRPVRA